MYKLTFDGIYSCMLHDLKDACFRICDYLNVFSLSYKVWEGVFVKTGMPYGPYKLKKYVLNLDTAPNINIELFKKDSEEIQPELVFYYFKKWEEKNGINNNRSK